MGRKAILFLCFGLPLFLFSQKQLRNGYNTRPEKFMGKVKYVTVDGYVRLANPTNPEADTLTWISTRKTRYDEQGVAREIYTYARNGKLVYIDTLKYDSLGNRLKMLFVNGHGDVYGKVLFSYDSLGRKIEERQYLQGNHTVDNTRALYKYDSQGNCVEWDCYNKGGVLTAKHILAYDMQGNNTEEFFLNIKTDSVLQRNVYAYDNLGNEIKKVVYARLDSLMWTDTSIYDKHGNLIKTYRFDKNGDPDKTLNNNYKYWYDKKGNWIQMEIAQQGEKTGMLNLRKIEYY